MKLEDKFFNGFFYSFLISVFLSSVVVTIILSFFTNNNYDKRTKQYIIDIEKKNSKKIANMANIVITTKIQKLQSGLNELILLYQKNAKKLLESNQDQELNTKFLKNLLTIEYGFCRLYLEDSKKMAFWFIDEFITENDLDDKKDIKNQLIAFNNIIPNLDSILKTTKPHSFAYYFYFDENELYISFPIFDACTSYYIYYMRDPFYSDPLCMNDDGEYFQVYKLKCENFFLNMMKSKSNIYDNNYLSNQHKTIFIANYYDVMEYDYVTYNKEFSMCIEFIDPITGGKGHACVDTLYTDTVSFLEELNSKIPGFFFVSNVGFNNLFYFPQGTSTPKTSTEQIYNWIMNFKLAEKTYFHDNIRKIISSSYNDYIGNSLFDEIYINGKNNSEQYFFINEEEFKYSLYPIFVEDLNGKKEHIMSIIYVYNDRLFLEKINIYTSSLVIKILLGLIIFIIFGYGLLYIIYLTFNTLAKHIVIPIKNINYMLKGINIGGKNRLKYLEYLERKRDENLEKLEKIYLNEKKKNLNEKSEDTESNLINNYDEYKDYLDNYNSKTDLNIQTKDSIFEKIKQFSDFNKRFDEENDFIEKEIDFYDFDELLLQYRCYEIENLVKDLMDLKSSMILTSKDRELEKNIDYSFSESIFRNFKNKEGAIICQSNLGNLQSQLLKFDKAIYHLALSLQDNDLRRFLSQNLTDEFDEDDSLLKLLSNSYGKLKQKEKRNILVNKQMNNSKVNFSQKKIGILINTRYCRLIHAYYMFFKNIQKLQKSNDYKMSGQFMNTLFHTINYYHKIIIQYIYLSYVKNDLVKIGESILDYIEFLIKFKFKTSSNDKNFLKIYYRGNPEFQEKQKFKKKIFDKIISWFSLFDEYISYVKDNSSLNDTKCIADDYSHNLNIENFEFDLESQTVFMFRINIQRSNFLKGKFSLFCKNYNDALFYFMSAAKKNSIVIDGLIKKRSLKHIYKLLKKMKKKFEKFGLKHLYMDKEIKKYQKDKIKINHKNKIESRNSNKLIKLEAFENITFGEEIEIIKRDIIKYINECNAKKEKDIMVLIDFNLYSKKEKNLNIDTSNINSFIEETILILNYYLSTNDRFGVAIYENDYQIICPLMRVDKIDNESFSKDLINFKEKAFNQKNEVEEFDINFEEIIDNDLGFNLSRNNLSENSEDDHSEDTEKYIKNNYDKIIGLVKVINNINNYIKLKGEAKNDKYIILFTDFFNIQFIEVEQIEKILEKLEEDKEVIFLLVGKNKNFNIKYEFNNFEINYKIEKLILGKFRENSEVINFENIKKIKTILSNSKVIKDEIIYPNEIYK